jgi:hypothetical protein
VISQLIKDVMAGRLQLMAGSLRSDEKSILDKLVAKLGCTYRAGEDPPDAYLCLGDVEVGVEITRLTPFMRINDGLYISSQEFFRNANLVCSKLESMLNDDTESELGVTLLFSRPVSNSTKTAELLKRKVKEMIADNSDKEHFSKFGNDISISLYKCDKTTIRSQFLTRERASDEVARSLLIESINKKSKKLRGKDGCWLVLNNEHMIASTATYQRIYNEQHLNHPFSKIIIINGDEIFYLTI